MLIEVAQELEDWIIERNGAALEEGLPALPPCTINWGKRTLMESGLPLTLVATNDIGVKAL